MDVVTGYAVVMHSVDEEGATGTMIIGNAVRKYAGWMLGIQMRGNVAKSKPCS